MKWKIDVNILSRMQSVGEEQNFLYSLVLLAGLIITQT